MQSTALRSMACLRHLALLAALWPGVASIRHQSWDGLWYSSDGHIPIWLWWNYSTDAWPPGYVMAAQTALEHFAPSDEFVIHKVNETNIRSFLPDFPQELSRTFVQASADMARAGLLGKYGGVYLDTDMLLAAPLAEMTNKLDDHDMVSYEVPGQSCERGSFSGNFMAARPGSALHTGWYKEGKALLKSRCTGDKKKDEDKVCCYLPSGSPMSQCHVSWTGLGEKIGHSVLARLLDKHKNKTKTSYKTFCYSHKKHESFAPCIDCFWTSIPGGSGLVNNNNCSLQGEDDLSCLDGLKVNFFKRRAYHLFSAITPANVSKLPFARLATGPWVFSHLFKRIMPHL